MTSSSKNFDRRLFNLWVAYAVAFGLTFLLPDFSRALSFWLEDCVPLIRLQINQPSAIGDLAARYFSLLILVVPIGAFYLMWRDSARERLARNLRRVELEGRSREGAIAFAYLLGIPFAVGMLYLMLAVPVESPRQSPLAGPRIIGGLLSSEIGVLLIGSTGAIAATLLLAGLYVLIWAPISKILIPEK